jgi:ribosomal-protein-alanine N-acetyltransferase
VTAAIRDPETDVLTAWVNERLVGFAIMQFFAEHAHLNLLAVEPEARRLGIGRQILEWLEETARVGGVFVINLEVRAGNAGARTFYRRLGYHETGAIPGYYSGREMAIRMSRDLRHR